MDERLTRETLVDKLSEEAGSPVKKYQEIYVGRSSLIDLLRYEILTSFLSPIPGALGFFLRKFFYKRLFAAVGKGLMIGPYVILRCPGRIWLGNNVVIDSNAVLDAKGEKSSIRVGNLVLLGKDSMFSCASATIELGSEVSIGPYCYIRASRGPIVMGSFITIGAQTVIISGNPDYIRTDIPMMKQVGSTQGITIEDDVWIGVGVRIIDGVRIGEGSIIGAGAVVIEDIPPNSIAVGVPAKVIRSRKKVMNQ